MICRKSFVVRTRDLLWLL